ncbi:tetratricopeptide repeat protein [Psychroflexus sediminis]|uniref:Uncharacterized protein n=1 Tax=Psychroflexus sediminis TaxID=470826 RepID=A0A1G7XIH8_9FLAO|nr:tetratricopeptide repeat protein [Psychroflexus sediminis]SDG84018.1 hypothetical protein SAMN04488027_108139 [Psychroflexus sediminis]
MKIYLTKIYLLILLVSLQFFQAKAQSVQNAEVEDKFIKQANTVWAEGEYDKAIILYENILDEKPDQYMLYENLVKAYAYLGMFETAEERAGELYGQYPDDAMMIGSEKCRLGLIYTMQNRNDEALRAVEQMIEISDPAKIFPGAPTCAFFFQTKAGEYEKASVNIEKLLKVVENAGTWRYLFLMYAAYVHDKLGEAEKSQRYLSELRQGMEMLQSSGALQSINNEQGAEIFIYIADYYAFIGEDEKAIASLQQHLNAGGRQYYWIKNVSPFSSELKENPEYLDILSKMKEDIDRMRSNIEAHKF